MKTELALSPLVDPAQARSVPPWWGEFIKVQLLILQELRAIRAAVEQRPRRTTSSAREADEGLIDGIAASIGRRAFQASDLVERAMVDGGLRACLREHVPIADEDDTTAMVVKLGRRLGLIYKRRAVSAGGLRVERIKKVTGGALWCLQSHDE